MNVLLQIHKKSVMSRILGNISLIIYKNSEKNVEENVSKKV